MRTNNDDWFQMLVAANLVERGMGKVEFSSGDAHRLILDMQDKLAEVAQLRAELAAAKEERDQLAAHDAEVKVAALREVARLVDSHTCELLMAEADRIEKEAKNGEENDRQT